jgi:hypothetical protein
MRKAAFPIASEARPRRPRERRVVVLTHATCSIAEFFEMTGLTLRGNRAAHPPMIENCRQFPASEAERLDLAQRVGCRSRY